MRSVWVNAEKEHYRCNICFENADGEEQNRRTGKVRRTSLCLCGSIESSAKTGTVTLHEKVRNR